MRAKKNNNTSTITGPRDPNFAARYVRGVVLKIVLVLGLGTMGGTVVYATIKCSPEAARVLPEVIGGALEWLYKNKLGWSIPADAISGKTLRNCTCTGQGGGKVYGYCQLDMRHIYHPGVVVTVGSGSEGTLTTIEKLVRTPLSWSSELRRNVTGSLVTGFSSQSASNECPSGVTCDE